MVIEEPIVNSIQAKRSSKQDYAGGNTIPASSLKDLEKEARTTRQFWDAGDNQPVISADMEFVLDYYKQAAESAPHLELAR